MMQKRMQMRHIFSGLFFPLNSKQMQKSISTTLESLKIIISVQERGPRVKAGAAHGSLGWCCTDPVNSGGSGGHWRT